MPDDAFRVLGRYALYGEIAAGGMATVHLGRLLGPVGFSRTVAIKRLHPQFAKDPDFVSMFVDEARLAARVQHPNVIPTLDIVSLEDELFIVMEYVEGESLARLLRSMRNAERLIPPTIVGAIMSGALYGLHAAHEAKSERGEPLQIIHRDVSPQNILVGVDGVPRVLDFGVAKAANRSQTTRDGQLKGKLAYMAPEQILGEERIDRRVDVYAAAVCCWEALVARRLFEGQNEGAIMKKVIQGDVPPPSSLVPDVPRAADAVLLKAMSRDREQRFATAYDFAVALEESLGADNPRRVAAFVADCARDAIARRSQRVRQLESLTEADLAAMMLPPPVSTASGKSGDRSAPTQVTRRRDRALVVALAIAAALGLATALAIVALVRGRGGDSAASSAPAVSVVHVVGTAPAPSEEPTASATAGSSTTAASAAASVAASITPTAPATATSRPPIVNTGTRPPPSATSHSTAAKPNCNPPYVIVDGIQKLKPECLE
jgi:serine/threonine-protein kinase